LLLGIPSPQFFLKKEFNWFTYLLGLGAWALDMPFNAPYTVVAFVAEKILI